jgi:hypothetical protein
MLRWGAQAFEPLALLFSAGLDVALSFDLPATLFFTLAFTLSLAFLSDLAFDFSFDFF